VAPPMATAGVVTGVVLRFTDVTDIEAATGITVRLADAEVPA